MIQLQFMKMKKVLLLLSFCLGLTHLVQSQTLVTISQIQDPMALSSCNDTSDLFGTIVKVRGVVVMDGGLAQSASGNNLWITDGSGGNHGLDVFRASGGTIDMLSLLRGDSIEVTGTIDEFQGETEIRPSAAGDITVLSSVTPRTATVVAVSDLMNNARHNKLTTGEQWEGQYVEIQNVVVTERTNFSGTRWSFWVRDAAGNEMNISDRFLAGRLPPVGTFVLPAVGDSFCFIRGVLMHNRTFDDVLGCLATDPASRRGYEIHPFDAADYGVCSAAPTIFNVTRTPVTPGSGVACTVSADITDLDGITSATLYYAVGIATGVYTPVTMSIVSGSTWSGVIPGQADGSFVKYYVSATDGAGNVGYNKDVPGGYDPYWYWVHDTGTEIYDLQYIPSGFTSSALGESPYKGLTVTVSGVITASAEPAGNLGYVFMQQEGKLAWAGIMLTQDVALASLTVGQKVTVTGTVEENFGFTRLNVTSVSVIGTGSIPALRLDPGLFTTYDLATNEAYESMLIAFASSTPGNKVYVVDQNADGPPSDFAEYRVGLDAFDPATGSRVLAGRSTTSANSSLNVSYITDSTWITTDGLINPSIPICIVYDGMSFDTIKGIMQYTFSNMKMTPRNNADFTGDPCILGRPSAADAASIIVYPNPASSEVNVRYNLKTLTGAVVNMYDLTGRKVAGININEVSGVASMSVSNLPSGTYIVTVSDLSGKTLSRGKTIVVH
jgi:DNA/RNA endonuclease YhcR with UshA esterase domain